MTNSAFTTTKVGDKNMYIKSNAAIWHGGVLSVLCCLCFNTPAFSANIPESQLDWDNVSECISGCMTCLDIVNTACCRRCGDSSGGGGGGGGYSQCLSAGCTNISERTEFIDFGSTASVLGNPGATGTTNICFDADGIQYYIKSASGCKSGYTRVKHTILGCSNVTYYKCMSDSLASDTGGGGTTGGTCDESTCVPTAWEMAYSGSNAVQVRTNKACSGNTCMTYRNKQTRCPKGFYGVPNANFAGSIVSYCTPCPSHSSGTQTTAGPGEINDGSIGVGTSATPGTVSITECYVIPNKFTGSDTSGSWACDKNAYYQQ